MKAGLQDARGLRVYSDVSACAATTARAWIGPKNGALVEMDFDRSTLAMTDPAIFTWGAAGGSAYLAFVGNAATHLIDNVMVSAVPEPAGLLMGLWAVVPLALRRRR